MLSCILLTLENTCVEDLKVQFTDKKQIAVDFDNDCYKSSNFTEIQVTMRFDKYNSVFNSKTNSWYEDVELKYDCSYAQPNSDCNLLFDDLVNGKEPKGDIRVTFRGRNSSELGENYSFSVDNKYDGKLSDEDITWIVVGSILGVALVTTLVLFCLCCCGCISCCCHCCCKPNNP